MRCYLTIINIIKLLILLFTTLPAWATDVTGVICENPSFTTATLTENCKQSFLSANLLCQGNEARVNCTSAYFDRSNTKQLDIGLHFYNKHKPTPDIVMYEYETDADLRIGFDEQCQIKSKEFDTSRLGIQLNFNIDLDQSMLNRFKYLCLLLNESVL